MLLSPVSPCLDIDVDVDVSNDVVGLYLFPRKFAP